METLAQTKALTEDEMYEVFLKELARHTPAKMVHYVTDCTHPGCVDPTHYRTIPQGNGVVAFARHYRTEQAKGYVSRVRHRTHPIPPWIADALGYTRIVTYVPKDAVQAEGDAGAS